MILTLTHAIMGAIPICIKEKENFLNPMLNLDICHKIIKSFFISL